MFDSIMTTVRISKSYIYAEFLFMEIYIVYLHEN